MCSKGVASPHNLDACSTPCGMCVPEQSLEAGYLLAIGELIKRGQYETTISSSSSGWRVRPSVYEE